MSLSAVPTEVVKVYDPRIDVLKQREYVITKGASKISYIPYKSLSTGNSSMSFNIIPPSRNTFVDRKMYVESTISLTFSVTVPTGKTLDGGIIDPIKDAPRSFPLSRALASAFATIGNTQVSIQTGDVVDALLRCMKVEELKEFNDGCPTALDRSQTYDCYESAPGLNVLGNYTQPILDNGEYARGYFNVTINPVQLSNGVATQTATFKVFEPVMLSPFIFSKLNHSSLIGLQNITLVYNFASNSELVWSGTQPVCTDGTLLNPTVNVQFAPLNSAQTDATCWVGYYSPSPLMEIPKEVTYNYYEVQRFLTNGFSPMSYGIQQTINSNNIQLKVIPSMIIVGVRRTKGNQRYWQPDAYMTVKKTSINFANTVGILSSASPFSLYSISKKNGLNYNFNEWQATFGNNWSDTLTGAQIPSGTGSLLVLKPSEDFGLSDAEASGLSGAFNFQVSLTVECADPSIAAQTPITDYELFVIVINEGQLSIDVAGTGSVVTNIGCISEADVLSAQTSSHIDYNKLNGLVGGDFLSSLKNFAQKASNVVHNVAKYAPMVSDGLKSVGLGRGAGHGAGFSGGELIGSAIASKKSLKDRLK
jgi:hypothetical protein